MMRDPPAPPSARRGGGTDGLISALVFAVVFSSRWPRFKVTIVGEQADNGRFPGRAKLAGAGRR